MAEVVLEHVSKIYANGVQAVRDLTLTVADGELVALVGPSGCGKTTTLRLIAGLEEATTGTIGIGGRAANSLPPRDRDVALVFQKHNLYPHLNVRDNLAFGLRLRHSAGRLTRLLLRWSRPARHAEVLKWERTIADRVSEAARVLELEDLVERFPSQLSGGQQQRAALGRALVRRPGVFLLDEPLSQLDAGLRAEMRRQLHLLHRRFQATMIYVTHDQVEAMALGDRLVVLDRGAVCQIGSPEQVYRHPRNRFVASFLGWPPMNFVEGRLVWEDSQPWFVAEGRKLPLLIDRLGKGRPRPSQPITLGIRPEHVDLSGKGDPRTAIPMEVVLVEPLGSDNLVSCQGGPWRIAAKMDGRRPIRSGQTVEAALDMNQALLFDSASGLALPDG